MLVKTRYFKTGFYYVSIHICHMMFVIDEKPDILINYTKGKPDLQY